MTTVNFQENAAGSPAARLTDVMVELFSSAVKAGITGKYVPFHADFLP